MGKRILGALIFRKSLFSEIEQKPDLYGPFWLSTTAIFMMAMISNALDYFAYSGDSDEIWEGDLKKIASGTLLHLSPPHSCMCILLLLSRIKLTSSDFYAPATVCKSSSLTLVIVLACWRWRLHASNSSCMCSVVHLVWIRFWRRLSVVGLAEGHFWCSNLFECTVVHVW